MTPDPVIPDSETPGYVVIEPDDITEAFVAPKTVTLQGAVYDGCDLVGLVELKLGKVHALEGSGKAMKLKKYTVNVSGFVLDGIGYGTATCKKPAISCPVTVK